MTRKKYRRYSPEFKRHTLKRASEDGVTDKGVCEELGISARQLRRWRAVDQDDEVVDVFLQARRDGRAATRFFKRLLKAHGGELKKLVTD